MNIAVFASHNGSNLQAMIDAIEKGSLAASISIVISNNSNSGALERATRHNIPGIHLSSVAYPDVDDLDEATLQALLDHETDIIFLAGYLKKIGPKVISQYDGKILNTHPALLPKYGGKGMYGMNVHKAVIEGKENKSGVTVHLVNSEYDEGKILTQAEVPVLEDDTPDILCERVMARERGFIIEVLNQIHKEELVL